MGGRIQLQTLPALRAYDLGDELMESDGLFFKNRCVLAPVEAGLEILQRYHS